MREEHSSNKTVNLSAVLWEHWLCSRTDGDKFSGRVLMTQENANATK